MSETRLSSGGRNILLEYNIRPPQVVPDTYVNTGNTHALYRLVKMIIRGRGEPTGALTAISREYLNRLWQRVPALCRRSWFGETFVATNLVTENPSCHCIYVSQTLRFDAKSLQMKAHRKMTSLLRSVINMATEKESGLVKRQGCPGYM